MPILATFTKQPADVQDYDIDYTDYCGSFEPPDSLLNSPVVTADVGITIDSVAVSTNVVKVWLRGGTTGTTYKITCRASTVGGRTREVEIKVKVKED